VHPVKRQRFSWLRQNSASLLAEVHEVQPFV
jgi:hypothetical protein